VIRRGLAILLLCSAGALAAPPADSDDATELISWLLEDGRNLEGIPFSRVIEASSGRQVIPVNPDSDRVRIETLSGAIGAAIDALNMPANPIHEAGRINEASRHVEDAMRAAINQIPNWSCGIPKTAVGAEQRSGYPDLRIVCDDGRIIYLDPKLFNAGSRASSLRTFYFEPKTKTGKVNDDAIHLLVGVQHNGKRGKDLRLERWELVDLSKLDVQLKAEFQASNKGLYRENAVVGRSAE